MLRLRLDSRGGSHQTPLDLLAAAQGALELPVHQDGGPESVPQETLDDIREKTDSSKLGRRAAVPWMKEKQGEIDIAAGTIGRLDATRLRGAIRAVGDVIDSDCEPN